MPSPSGSIGSGLRRSSRERRPRHTVYDEAAEQLNTGTSPMSSGRKRKKADSEDERDNSENGDIARAEHESSEEDSEESDSDSADDMERRSQRKEKKSSLREPAPKKRSLVESKGGAAKGKPSTSSRPPQGKITAAWKSLVKTVLDEKEKPENSLLAAIMAVGAMGTSKNKARNAKLDELTRHLIRDHFQNDNALHTRLYNLIFRVCGGSLDSLMPEDVDLENLSGEDFVEYVSVVVQSMEETDLAAVLWTASPPSAAVKLQFRDLYQDFWHALGVAALESTDKNSGGDNDTEGSNIDKQEGKDKMQSSPRFQVEVVRTLVVRLYEMTFLQQDDLRSAVVSALYSLATAVLHKTVELRDKLQTAQRQYQTAKRHKQRRKSEALKAQVDTGKRMIEDLQDIVTDTVVGVFLKRYKDTNANIRAASMLALGDFVVIRPDIFFDKEFLKYIGWTLNDKEAIVREAALSAFLLPCKQNKYEEKVMEAFVEKFAPRLADMTIDVDTRVQERAMELLLIISRAGIFDVVQDEETWNRINLRALHPNTTPLVRKLAFLFIVEQLGAFDEDVPDTTKNAVDRIDELAAWISHNLSVGDIPLDRVRTEYAAFMVQSIRGCSEHLSLVRNFVALVGALENSLGAKVSHSGSKSGRRDRVSAEVKQRVLLEFLMSAVEEEVPLISPEHIVDPDLRTNENSKRSKAANRQEELTRALLPLLTKLMHSFKSETIIMRRLTLLPLYFAPSTCSSSDQKNNFKKMLSSWSSALMEADDEIVIENACHVLCFLANADHPRRNDVVTALQDVVTMLSQRFDELYIRKVGLAGKNSDNSDSEESNSSLEKGDEGDGKSDLSISLLMIRLSVISKRWPLADLLEQESEDAMVDELCEKIFKLTRKELDIRKPVVDDEKLEIQKVWSDPSRCHSAVNRIVASALDTLLSTAGWAVRKKLSELESSSNGRGNVRSGPNPLLVMRERIETILSLCFEQFTDGDHDYTEENVRFAREVQEVAGQTSGDLRTLFPREWSKSVDPILREAALTDDSLLIGGYVRFVKSEEAKLRDAEGKEDADPWIARKLLLPIARGLCPNWESGNRREAAMALSHITNSGAEASALVSAMSKALKKMKPVRLLEAHMACLRQEYESWAESEPEEPQIEDPSDEEIRAFEAEEKLHEEKFQVLEHQAQRLSSSLGVGRINDQELANALLGFVREGVRFAFSRVDASGGEELFLGARLPFLRLLTKYLVWVRKNKQQVGIIREEFNQKEEETRSHPDFHQVLETDIEAMNLFRKAGELGAYVVEDDTTVGDRSFAASSRASSRASSVFRRRYSHGGSISSVPSKVSTQKSDLSPLPEEKEEEVDEDDKAKDGSPGGKSSLGSSSRMFSPESKVGLSTADSDDENDSI